MLRLTLAVLYTALAVSANPALAGTGEAAQVVGQTEGMKRLVFQDPQPLPDEGFTDRQGRDHAFPEWKGHWLVVNFWATWCGPCRKEMPSLDALAGAYADKGLAVLPIATGRNPSGAMDRFLQETGVANLTVYLDPKQALARKAGVLGLPMTLLVDPQGQIVARMIGDADWAGPDAHKVFDALLAD